MSTTHYEGQDLETLADLTNDYAWMVALLGPLLCGDVVSVNVLEHVPDDVGLLSEMREVTRPGGAVLLTVPAIPALYGTLDAKVDHVRRYRKREMLANVTLPGSVVESIGYFDFIGVLPWFVAGRGATTRPRRPHRQPSPRPGRNGHVSA